MPLETHDIALSAEVDRLTDAMADHADAQADAPMGSDAAKQAAQAGQRANHLRDGVAWAAAEWEADSVTLATLTYGERTRAQDTADEKGWPLRACHVAAGTYDAPYLAHDPEAVTQDEYEATVLNVVDLHPAFVDWADQRIQELGGVGGETGKSYPTLVLERRSRRDSERENG